MRELATFQEYVDYEYVLDETTDTENQDTNVNIKLTSGPFEGVVFQYGKVSIDPIQDPEVDNLELRYEFNLISSDKFSDEELSGNLEFKNYLGDLLVSIICNRLEENENRTDDIEELDS
jgi:hypothetical protein